jgi:4-coumarate--CoA ligase
MTEPRMAPAHRRIYNSPLPDVEVPDLPRFVASHVASYKQIRRLEVIEAIPKSAAGKILRRVLRDAATAQADPPARRPEK